VSICHAMPCQTRPGQARLPRRPKLGRSHLRLETKHLPSMVQVLGNLGQLEPNVLCEFMITVRRKEGRGRMDGVYSGEFLVFSS